MNGASPGKRAPWREKLRTQFPLWLLLKTNLVQARRKLRTASSRSGFLTAMIVAFIGLYPPTAAGLFYLGLKKISTFPGIGAVVIEELVFILFAFLFCLLLFSNVVVGFSNLFRNREAQFLLTMPLSPHTIFRWKFIESTIIASWAFLLLVAPLLAAYGIQQGTAWHFYLLTPVLVCLFIILPAVAGCWLAIFLARHLDRRRLVTLAFPAILTIVLGLYVYMQPEIVADESLGTSASEERARLLGKARFAQWPFMPSYWLSKSVIEWKDGVFSVSVFYILVMISNVLFFGCLAFTQSGRYFYSAMSATLSRGNYLVNWRGHLGYAGTACAVLLGLSFFLPYLSTTPALKHASAEITAMRMETAQSRGKSFSEAEMNASLEGMMDQIAHQLGPSQLGGLAVTPAEIEEERPGFQELPARIAKGRGAVDINALEAELGLRLGRQFHQNLSGLDLALGHRPRKPPGPIAASPPWSAAAILFAIPFCALVAGLSRHRVWLGIAALVPLVAMAIATLPAGYPPLQLIGLGAWLACLSSLGLLATAMGWWDRPEAARDPYQLGVLDRVARWIPALAPDARAMLLKDIRVFWRDTAQWSQTLVLFGILGVYIMNLRYFTSDSTPKYWINVVSYMNLAACALNLATLTTRFVYPQFSLEGKRLWIVGLAPMGLARVVRIKLGLAIAISLLISMPLIWLSCQMLKLSMGQTLYFTFGIIIMVITLNCLAIGMGVLYPNLKVDNPSKIVSGFGGTFCLVVSFVYIGGSVMFLGRASPWFSPWHLMHTPTSTTMIVFGFLFLLLSFTIGVMPMILARDKLKRFEQ